MSSDACTVIHTPLVVRFAPVERFLCGTGSESGVSGSDPGSISWYLGSISESANAIWARYRDVWDRYRSLRMRSGLDIEMSGIDIGVCECDPGSISRYLGSIPESANAIRARYRDIWDRYRSLRMRSGLDIALSGIDSRVCKAIRARYRVIWNRYRSLRMRSGLDIEVSGIDTGVCGCDPGSISRHLGSISESAVAIRARYRVIWDRYWSLRLRSGVDTRLRRIAREWRIRGSRPRCRPGGRWSPPTPRDRARAPTGIARGRRSP